MAVPAVIAAIAKLSEKTEKSDNSESKNSKIPEKLGEKGLSENIPDKLDSSFEKTVTSDSEIPEKYTAEPNNESTDKQKQEIMEDSGWSEEIVNNISSKAEYDIYHESGLHEAEIGENKALIKDGIDWNRKDEFGRTNQERTENGLPPLDRNGKPIELHHIGQHADSPLAELTVAEHRGTGNNKILHPNRTQSEVHFEGDHWNSEKNHYWKNRAEYNLGGKNDRDN